MRGIIDDAEFSLFSATSCSTNTIAQYSPAAVLGKNRALKRICLLSLGLSVTDLGEKKQITAKVILKYPFLLSACFKSVNDVGSYAFCPDEKEAKSKS
jgi:hypothetical protein